MCQDQVGCRFAFTVGSAYLQQWDCGVCVCVCLSGRWVKECCRYGGESQLPLYRTGENNECIRNPTLLVSSCAKEWTAERYLSLCNSAKREWCLPLASGRVKKSKSVVQRNGCSWLQGVVGQEPRIVLSPRSFLSVPVPFLGDLWAVLFRSNTTGPEPLQRQFQWNLGKPPQSISNARPGLCTTLFEILEMGRVIHAAPSFLFAHQPQVRRHARGTLWVSDRGQPHSTGTSSTVEAFKRFCAWLLLLRDSALRVPWLDSNTVVHALPLECQAAPEPT